VKSSLSARAALALGTTVLALLVAAGALALATGKPLFPGTMKLLAPNEPRRGAGGSSGASSGADGSTQGGTGAAGDAGDAGDGVAGSVGAGSLNAGSVNGAAVTAADDKLGGGLYRVHADPLVGYVLKSGLDRRVLAGRVRSDELGLRARASPPRGDDPLRIVLAGDSVAFGFGLEAEQTIAARLEAELNAALGAGARPVECRSVALPGWNHRNTVAAVLDHADVLDPDIVVYMPVPNDVFDTDAMDEAGYRRIACDPSSADPWLLVNQTNTGRLEMESARRLRAAGRDDSWSTLGPQAITADLSPESMRRLDENEASLARLRQHLLSRGGHFLVAPCEDDAYSQHLLRRFDEQFVPIDVVPLFATLPAELKLPDDPHPGAEAASAMARWIAADLLARGWVTGAVHEIPPVTEAIEAQRARVHKPKERELLSAQTRRMQWHRLLRVIDLPAGDGCNQIYGGVYPDGTAGPHALFLLPRPARTLLVQLAALPGRPDLLPLDVTVQVDGQDVGTLRLAAEGAATESASANGTSAEGAAPESASADGSVTARFELPQPAATAANATFPGVELPMEVRLVSAGWVVQPVDLAREPAGDVNVLAAYRVVRLEALPD